MMLPTGITYAITLIFFGVLGVMQYHGGDADMSRVIEFSNALNAAEGGIFNINPLLLLPPVVVIVAVALRLNAPAECLKLVSAIIVAVAIAFPYLKKQMNFYRQKRAAKAQNQIYVQEIMKNDSEGGER